MDILFLSIKDNKLSLIIRFTDIYTNRCKSVTVYSTATVDKKCNKDNTVTPHHIFSIKDFDKGIFLFFNAFYLETIRQNINSFLKTTYAD